MAGGALSRHIAQWQHRVLMLSAQIEALLDFADEDDVDEDDGAIAAIVDDALAIAAEWTQILDHPPAERLRDGVRVVIAGPPNSGKSTLINSLVSDDVAIVSPHAGTTRDVIDIAIQLAGRPFRLSDTAGLRADPGDAIEQIGIERALARMEQADIILWLGEPAAAPTHPAVIRVAAQADRFSPEDPAWVQRCAASDAQLSAVTGQGMDTLVRQLTHMADSLLPSDNDLALNARQRGVLTDCVRAISGMEAHRDPLIIADSLRVVRVTLDRMTGRAGTEAMLDALFGQFCIGK
jgi:tRNA modification GTPase